MSNSSASFEQYRDLQRHRKWFDENVRAVDNDLFDKAHLGEDTPGQLVEEVIAITPGAIATRTSEDTYLYLVDSPEIDLVPVMVGAEVSSNARASSNQPGRHNISPRTSASSFERRLQSAMRRIDGAKTSEQTGQRHATTPRRSYHQPHVTSSEGQTEEVRIESALEALFSRLEASGPDEPTRHKQTPTQKTPRKLAQILFKNRYIFEGSEFDLFGHEVSRFEILTRRTHYIRDAFPQHNSPSEHNRSHKITKPRTRRLLGAVAIGALAITSIGTAIGLAASTQSERSAAPAVVAAVAEQHTTQSSTTTIDFAQEQGTVASLSSEELQALEIIRQHPVEFENLVKWINEHPGEDFEAAYQQAFGA